MTTETKIATNNNTVDTANNLPTGNITVSNGTEAWAIVGKYFPNGATFSRNAKGFNNEDTFSYTNDEIIFAVATCTPDNRRVECVEVINTNESGSKRHVLTAYIKHDAATENAEYKPQCNWENPHDYETVGNLNRARDLYNHEVETATPIIISYAQYKDLLAWAEKVSNGQIDAATQIKTHCAAWLNVEVDKKTVIDIINTDDLNGFRNFLSQFNFAVKDDAGYLLKLYPYNNGTCVLEEIPSCEYSTYVKDGSDAKAIFDKVVKTRHHGMKHGVTKQGRHMWFYWGGLVSKSEAEMFLARHGFTIDEFIAAEPIAEEYMRKVEIPRLKAIDKQAEYLEAKINRDCKASNEQLPALIPAEDDDTDDELIDPPSERYDGYIGDEQVSYWNGKLIYITSRQYGVSMNLHPEAVKILGKYLVQIPDGKWEKFIKPDEDTFWQIMIERGACSLYDEDNKKSKVADSLTRAMTTALEHYQDFCRAKNLTGAENELKLYNICRKAMTELWKG